MTDVLKSSSVSSGKKDENGQKTSQKCSLSKVVIRRLPNLMESDEFLQQISPLPPYDYYYFVKADPSLFPWAFSRAYFGFRKSQDVFNFRDRFNGYVFVDSRGDESIAVVEMAPNPKIPTKSVDKIDSKCGTIEDDPDYKKFLEDRENPQIIDILSLDERLKECEENARTKKDKTVQETPLVSFVLKKKEEQWRKKVEKRNFREEERKKRLTERAEIEKKEWEMERKKKDEKEKAKKKTKDDEKPNKKEREETRNNAKDEKTGHKNKETPNKMDTFKEKATSSRKSHEKPPRFSKSHTKDIDDTLNKSKIAGKNGGEMAENEQNDQSNERQSRKNRERPERVLYKPGMRKNKDPGRKPKSNNDR